MHKSPSIAIIKYTSEFFKPKSYKKYDCHCSPLDGADKKYKRQNIRWWMSWLTGRMHKSPSIAIIKYTFELLKPKSYKKYGCHCSTLDGADKKYKRQNIRWWMSWLTGRKHKSQSLNTCEVWKKSFKKYGFHWIFVGAHTFEKRGGVYHICELSPSPLIDV